jgi:hypothetical protein
MKDSQNIKSSSIKRIIVVSIVVASLLMAFFATTNAATSSSPNCVASPDSFTTTIVGVTTNVVYTPITINGNSFTTSNIHNYLVQSDTGTVSISASNFIPGDYVQFAVTITNTGTATLAFQPYGYNNWFVYANGLEIPSADYPSVIVGYPAPTSIVNIPWTLTNFGTDTLSTYLTYLDGSRSTNWVMDFSYTKAATLPTTLAPKATFTYNLYVGLGSNVPYGIPGRYFSLSIPLTPSLIPTPTPCPTPTPKPTPTPTPTPTPKPTPTPTPTHTPCPTPTPKPTATPTPTATPKPCPTPKPTATPTPTATPKPCPTPKPTATPTPTSTPKPTSCPKPTPKPTATPTPTATPKPCPTPTHV